jgi:hypothetical protein
MTPEEKRRAEDRTHYPIRLWPFLWGGLVFAVILIISIITTVLERLPAR